MLTINPSSKDRTVVYKEFPVKSVEDLDEIRIPSPHKDGHLPMILPILEVVSDNIDDKVPILQCTNGPCGYAALETDEKAKELRMHEL